MKIPDQLKYHLKNSSRIIAIQRKNRTKAVERKFITPRVPTFEELTKSRGVSSLEFIPSLSGLVDGVHTGTDAANNVLHASSGIVDGIPDFDFGLGFPIITLITQGTKEALLLCNDQTDFKTAAAHVGISVGSVGTLSLGGTVIGGIFGPPGMIVGAMIGGLIGGGVAQKLKERKYRTAVKHFNEARQGWIEKVNKSRDACTTYLGNTAYQIQEEYSRRLLGIHERNDLGGGRSVTKCRLLDWTTRPLAWMPRIQSMRDRLAAEIRGENTRSLAKVRQETWAGRRLFRQVTGSLKGQANSRLEQHSQIVVEMVEDLKRHHAIIRSTLRKLGYA